MDRVQRESRDVETQTKPDVQAKVGGSGGDASVSYPPVQAKEGGGGAGSWNADAGLMSAFGIQHKLGGGGDPDPKDVHATAAQGVSGSGGALPHLDTIQQSFGQHDVSGVQAHTGSAANDAAGKMGAEAYATGNSVAFGSASPSLHTAAHEAAHVVQQRQGVSLAGGVGEAGDGYEQHADAVADRVVAGKSASDLLGPAGGSSSSAVQKKAVQFDIKADLKKAMEGWGTDEKAIFARLQRATAPELQAVIADSALMTQLKKELSRSDMEKVLDMLAAPLAQKLRLAISGWFTNDNDYVIKSLNRATPEELAATGQDTALVNDLVKTLNSNVLKSVLDRMSVPLKRKIQWALSGWGKDEAYIGTQLATAPLDQVVALAGDTGTLVLLDAEGLTSLRGRIAIRIFPGGGSADDAFKVIMSGDDSVLDSRLTEYGGLEQQRTLCDGVIVAGLDAQRIQRAFHAYWGVQLDSAKAVGATTKGGDNGAPSVAVGARDWPIPTLQVIHNQLKKIPQDARAGVWKKLVLTNDPALINRAAYGDGEFDVGSNASTTSTVPAGYSVNLTTAAATAATSLVVNEGTRFKVGDKLVLARQRTGAAEPVTVTAIAGNTYTIGTALTKEHPAGELLDPDDGSGKRQVLWLEQTVRHEIAHSLDGGGVDTKPFYAKGAWVLGAGDAGYDVWLTAMGGASAYNTNDGTKIIEADQKIIKATIVDHVTNQKGSLHALLDANTTHPITVNKGKNVPVIVAAEQCLALGDNFWTDPQGLYSSNGHRFSISRWYKRFQYHNESVVADRVADYGLYAPTEFFAEAYTVFYEEAGKEGMKEEDYGRLIRNNDWRNWIRDNVHNRGLAPAGTGAAKTPGGAAPAPGAPEPGAKPGGAATGRATGNPGL